MTLDVTKSYSFPKYFFISLKYRGFFWFGGFFGLLGFFVCFGVWGGFLFVFFVWFGFFFNSKMADSRSMAKRRLIFFSLDFSTQFERLRHMKLSKFSQ